MSVPWVVVVHDENGTDVFGPYDEDEAVVVAGEIADEKAVECEVHQLAGWER